MTHRRMILALTLCALVLGIAGQASADISNAAVLYLRIAAGARAAGMGEAFVAVADDATATHWNPAGLGAYPLANSWVEAKVPGHLRPIKALATYRKGGGGDYQAYEVWAITNNGVARYDNAKWHADEKFSPSANKTLRALVAQYFSITDEEMLTGVVHRVAEANSQEAYDAIVALRDEVMAAVAEDYSDRESMTMMFDSLMVAYDECRIDWGKIAEVRKHFNDGMSDSSLTEIETDRINIAVEKARMRFIAAEISVPYSVVFGSQPSSIAAIEKGVLFGGNDGLTAYNGRAWSSHNVEAGLPSDTVLCIAAVGEQAFIGTSAGLARFAGQRLGPVQGFEELPEGPVRAVGASSLSDVWVVINNDLFHWDGSHWSNSFSYNTVLDDNRENIARRMGIYGSEIETQAYMEKLDKVNAEFDWSSLTTPLTDEMAETVTDTAGATAMPEDLMSGVIAGTGETDSTQVDSVEVAAEVEEVVEEPEIIPAAAPSLDNLQAGVEIRLPFVSELKGEIGDIFVGRDMRLWIATEYGLLYFNGRNWETPGYRRYRIKTGDTFDALVSARRTSDISEADAYAAQLRDINDLEEDAPLTVGQVVKIYRNPLATNVTSIIRGSRSLYVGTDEGLIEFDGIYWARSAVRGMAQEATADAHSHENELWISSRDKLVIKASAQSQLSFMHAKWLPELTDDVYYEYFSAVFGTENWGTFGGNVTFITYGEMVRMDQHGEAQGTFSSFDLAATFSYGAALSQKLKVGLSAKLLYSRLSDIGAGFEKGKGTSTGFAVDFGMLYHVNRRLNLGMALTNLGPNMAYIDAAQSDPLPVNLALGFAYKLLQSDYYSLLVTAEMNKIMVGLDDGFGEELKQAIANGGFEFKYGNLIAFRAGYIYDQEGDVKTPTLGVGVYPVDWLQFDFAYIPSGGESAAALKNTLRSSLTLAL